MKDFKFEIKGINEVRKMLSSLPQEVNDKILFDINKAAARIVKKQLEEDAPDSNSDKKNADKVSANVVIKKSKSKTGVNIGFKRKVWYTTLIERGTRVRKTLGKGKYRKGANRGKMTRKPFIAQAHQKAAPAVVNYFTTNYLKLVNRSLKRQAARINRIR
jgi:HK97 gp10 family phage protein